ncbi:tRNA (guanosine(46)-N7)-methyltransferase TrmB [Sporosarcina gallistercoris]|uniref:tRNA (guanine-N(7)-)-methyltransferase n=1 Tax=Sporosarcina gallistercoris TaxID=2762245 RepID=A0ABR8PIC4_9BACL|nr:tRNA (guanosine(46)-N7)-methyltransferase TrmB [Sporosarcina gallistercoris]MBD7907893.1 tRNA (guanosine(46)-N7)-methyltransferase TrmB [Sporosarcina gallistercoris]
MRLRHKPWAKDYLEEHAGIVIKEPETKSGKWSAIFGNDNPVHVEVGTGKGQFVVGMALANPDINYIGIEHFDSIIVSAVEKVVDSGVPSNLRLLRANGKELTNIFEKGEVSRVYLNFSDPWPKSRHAKRRLTHGEFLKLYQSVMPEDGEIHFKTDNRGLFEYSLVSMSEYGMRLLDVSLDLHAEMPEDNVMTEYEEKFSAKGQPIYRLEARFMSKV